MYCADSQHETVAPILGTLHAEYAADCAASLFLHMFWLGGSSVCRGASQPLSIHDDVAHAVLRCTQNATLFVPNVAVRFDYSQVTAAGATQFVSLFYSDRAATTNPTITSNLKQTYGVRPCPLPRKSRPSRDMNILRPKLDSMEYPERRIAAPIWMHVMGRHHARFACTIHAAGCVIHPNCRH